MHAFLVELENKPGELARVTEAIAAKGIDINGVSGSTCGSSGSVALMTDNDDATRTALGGRRRQFPRDGADPGRDRRWRPVRWPRPAGGSPTLASTSRP